MSIFKGTIEKRIMSSVKDFIKKAEEEFDNFVAMVEEKHDEDVKKLGERKDADIKEKEEAIVGRLVGKFL